MQGQSQDIDIDLKGLLTEIWNKKLLVLLITVGTGAGLFVFFSSMAPWYNSNARILIENRESIFTRTGQTTGNEERFDKEAIGSQVEVMRSDAVALATIKALDLAEHPAFEKEAKPSTLGKMLQDLGLKQPEPVMTTQSRLLDRFKQNLSVYSLLDSRVIAVQYSSTYPKLAQQVPNEMAKQYLAYQKNADLGSTEDATEWLAPEVEKLRERVRQAEAKVEEYRSSTDLVVGQNNGLLATQQLSEISSELTRLRAERSQAEARAAAIRKALAQGSSLDSIPEVMNSQVVQRLKDREMVLRGQLSDLSTTLLPNHPRIKALSSQISDIDGQVRVATQNILTSLTDNVDYTREKENELVQELNRLKSESARVSEAAVDLRALEREAQAERELLQTYLRRLREASSRQNSGYQPVNARIISLANLPTKSYFPKVVPFTLAGTLAAFLMSVLAILTVALLSGKAFRASGAMAAGGYQNQYVPVYPSPPVQSAMPTGAAAPSSPPIDPPAPRPHKTPQTDRPTSVGRGKSLVDWLMSKMKVSKAKKSPAASTKQDVPIYAPLASVSVDHLSEAISRLENARVVLFTPVNGHGSDLGAPLARNLAARSQRTTLLDLSPQANATLEMLGSAHTLGIGHVLVGQSQLSEVTFSDRMSAASIIPQGLGLTTIGEPMAAKLAEFADSLELSNAFLIIDGGAMTADGIYSIARADSLIIVDGAASTREECETLELELGIRGYTDVTVLNDPRAVQFQEDVHFAA